MNRLKSRLFSQAAVALLAVACAEIPTSTEAEFNSAAAPSATATGTIDPLASAEAPAPDRASAAAESPANPGAPPAPATADLAAATESAPDPAPEIAAADPVPVAKEAALAPEPAAAPAPSPIASPPGEPVLVAAAAQPASPSIAQAPPAAPAPAPAPPKPATWEDNFTALLRKYASASGVAYKKWHANPADIAKLNAVTSSISSATLSGKSTKEKLAFYLNAYNAWILKRILDEYPVKGPGNGSTIKRAYFFKSKSIIVAGKETSFSALENDVIRPAFSEPRIHFALNCASASCPPLHTRAFDAATLDATLTKLARAFVNRNPLGFQVSGGKARVSKIFDWYGDDFKSAGGVLPYINQYRDTPVSTKLKVEFMTYDWSLNETP